MDPIDKPSYLTYHPTAIQPESELKPPLLRFYTHRSPRDTCARCLPTRPLHPPTDQGLLLYNLTKRQVRDGLIGCFLSTAYFMPTMDGRNKYGTRFLNPLRMRVMPRYHPIWELVSSGFTFYLPFEGFMTPLGLFCLLDWICYYFFLLYCCASEPIQPILVIQAPIHLFILDIKTTPKALLNSRALAHMFACICTPIYPISEISCPTSHSPIPRFPSIHPHLIK